MDSFDWLQRAKNNWFLYYCSGILSDADLVESDDEDENG